MVVRVGCLFEPPVSGIQRHVGLSLYLSDDGEMSSEINCVPGAVMKVWRFRLLTSSPLHSPKSMVTSMTTTWQSSIEKCSAFFLDEV